MQLFLFQTFFILGKNVSQLFDAKISSMQLDI